ncbi:hypothetical protein E2C01_046181 [Portunus trituberculatus]|uniref:Uncharacterized protein n=1 Tax=Portunus trituberculatus TaxID=210409 RepID=A0A5B7G3P5_PORTR|nr:hypothetical protein [Portunus trituberculatus]
MCRSIEGTLKSRISTPQQRQGQRAITQASRQLGRRGDNEWRDESSGSSFVRLPAAGRAVDA